MEIRYGLALNPAITKLLSPIIDSLLHILIVPPYEEKEAWATATIRAALNAPIGPYDVMIAGTTQANQLVMVTSNTGAFERVQGLLLEDWR